MVSDRCIDIDTSLAIAVLPEITLAELDTQAFADRLGQQRMARTGEDLDSSHGGLMGSVYYLAQTIWKGIHDYSSFDSRCHDNWGSFGSFEVRGKQGCDPSAGGRLMNG